MMNIAMHKQCYKNKSSNMTTTFELGNKTKDIIQPTQFL